MSADYTQDRQFMLQTLDLDPVIRHLENHFGGDAATALTDVAEAKKWYELVLTNAGRICTELIAPRAAAVDSAGCSFHQGEVTWAPETQENMRALAQAGYMGGILPRKYGGLNLPISVNNIIIEMVSQADASLMNLFGLQDIAVTVYRYGSEAQKDRVLPKFARGEVSGSMALTEPDAGSDLQAVSLKAIEKDGRWYLDGVKRFITNGCGDVSVVLARSEPGTTDGRGLSLFLYERESHMIVRRIEDKLGIHGSPTCELQFNMAPAELIGKRKFGLIKYVMNLMNGARLAVSAQALGIAQAAFDEAVLYANDREQFGRAIAHFPAVYQMLKNMEVEIETTRALLYHTALRVDEAEMYEYLAGTGDAGAREKVKNAANMASFLTPLGKMTTTELANKAAYDSLQIHGGVGFMKDFSVERLYRDARITNIYEGTTQLQVVAAIGGITTGLFGAEMKKLETIAVDHLKEEKALIQNFIAAFEDTVAAVKQLNSKSFLDYAARDLVEMASIIYRAYLYLPIADKFAHKRPIFDFFLHRSSTRLDYLAREIKMLQSHYGADIDRLKTPFIR